MILLLEPSSATIFSDAEVDYTEKPPRPVIWLWNDGDVQKIEAWGPK